MHQGVCGARGETLQGFEMQMGVNYIGHALLIRLLLPLMQAQSSPSRIIAVSSLGHRFGILDPSDLQCTYTRFFGWGSYLTSKLALVVYIKALQYHLDSNPYR
jgi:NAD(P)-dependent dehydrogenase (short-subunit alcohol dehydrogenase family)